MNSTRQRKQSSVIDPITHRLPRRDKALLLVPLNLAKKKIRGLVCCAAMFAAGVALLPVASSAAEAIRNQTTTTVVARVGETVITADEYEKALHVATRRKFYHGKAPEGELASLQREVAENLVTNVLLVKEAKRRGIKPEMQAIKQTLTGYDERYRDSQQWKMNRAVLMPSLQKQLEQESLLKQLSDAVHNVAQLDAKQVQAYYSAHTDKFTEPERPRVSVIMLKVEPSAPRPTWDKAREEAAALVKRLRAGADFAETAKLRSADESAPKGGDMGYLHRGMLADSAQAVVDKLNVKEISEPVTLLQGVAIFRLDERKPASVMPLDKVEQRARELWRREQGELAWQALLTKLRKSTQTVIDDSRFLPLANSALAARGKPKE